MSQSVFDDTYEFVNKLGYEFPNVPTIIPNIHERLEHIHEEMVETGDAAEIGDIDGVVDGLIDLIYIAAGTLEMMNVDSHAHWDLVQSKNIVKERGSIAKREGHMFDAVKPEGWTPPDHRPILEARGWRPGNDKPVKRNKREID